MSDAISPDVTTSALPTELETLTTESYHVETETAATTENEFKLPNQVYSQIAPWLEKRNNFGGKDVVEIKALTIPGFDLEKFIAIAQAKGRVVAKDASGNLFVFKNQNAFNKSGSGLTEIDTSTDSSAPTSNPTAVGKFINSIKHFKVGTALKSIVPAIKEVPVNIATSLPGVKKIREKMSAMSQYGEYGEGFLEGITGKNFGWGKAVNIKKQELNGKVVLNIEGIIDLNSTENAAQRLEILKKLGMGGGSVGQEGHKLLGLQNALSKKEILGLLSSGVATGLRVGSWVLGGVAALASPDSMAFAAAQAVKAKTLDAMASGLAYFSRIVYQSKGLTQVFFESIAAAGGVATSLFLSDAVVSSLQGKIEKFAAGATAKVGVIMAYATLLQAYANVRFKNPEQRNAWVRERIKDYSQLMAVSSLLNVFGRPIPEREIGDNGDEVPKSGARPIEQAVAENPRQGQTTRFLRQPLNSSQFDAGNGDTLPPDTPSSFDINADGQVDTIDGTTMLTIFNDGRYGFVEGTTNYYFTNNNYVLDQGSGVWGGYYSTDSSSQTVGLILGNEYGGVTVAASDITSLDNLLQIQRPSTYTLQANSYEISTPRTDFDGNEIAVNYHGETLIIYNLSTRVIDDYTNNTTGIFTTEEGANYFIINQFTSPSGFYTAEIVNSSGQSVGMIINGQFFDNDELAAMGQSGYLPEVNSSVGTPTILQSSNSQVEASPQQPDSQFWGNASSRNLISIEQGLNYQGRQLTFTGFPPGSRIDNDIAMGWGRLTGGNKYGDEITYVYNENDQVIGIAVADLGGSNTGVVTYYAIPGAPVNPQTMEPFTIEVASTNPSTGADETLTYVITPALDETGTLRIYNVNERDRGTVFQSIITPANVTDFTQSPGTEFTSPAVESPAVASPEIQGYLQFGGLRIYGEIDLNANNFLNTFNPEITSDEWRALIAALGGASIVALLLIDRRRRKRLAAAPAASPPAAAAPAAAAAPGAAAAPAPAAPAPGAAAPIDIAAIINALAGAIAQNNAPMLGFLGQVIQQGQQNAIQLNQLIEAMNANQAAQTAANAATQRELLTFMQGINSEFLNHLMKKDKQAAEQIQSFREDLLAALERKEENADSQMKAFLDKWESFIKAANDRMDKTYEAHRQELKQEREAIMAAADSNVQTLGSLIKGLVEPFSNLLSLVNVTTVGQATQPTGVKRAVKDPKTGRYAPQEITTEKGATKYYEYYDEYLTINDTDRRTATRAKKKAAKQYALGKMKPN